jgi:predicted membrane metal-binding protein
MVEIGSNRKFGLAFGVLFGLVGLWPLVHRDAPRWWALPIAAALLALAWVAPHWLAPLNRGWFKLGLALNRIVSPIVMGALFFGAVTPLAWFLRLKGKDLLSLKRAPEVETYWIVREPPGPAPGSMMKQF